MHLFDLPNEILFMIIHEFHFELYNRMSYCPITNGRLKKTLLSINKQFFSLYYMYLNYHNKVYLKDIIINDYYDYKPKEEFKRIMQYPKFFKKYYMLFGQLEQYMHIKKCICNKCNVIRKKLMVYCDKLPKI